MKWISDLTQLLFPRYCKVCGRRLMHSEQHLCIVCLMELPRTHYDENPNNVMAQHFFEWPQIQRCTAYFHYRKDNNYKQLIYHLKYHDHPEVGIYLGSLAAEELGDFFKGIDLIIPVPLSRQKKRQRGYNQCEYIARGIRQYTGIPIDITHVCRTVNTETQTRKTKMERWQNACSIFQVVHPEELQGKHILLVDDVMTTGATLHACAQVLIENVLGISVSIFTLATGQ